jgi:hypothetical protein
MRFISFLKGLIINQPCKKFCADNIDLNTETIDGKDTFHSMARAVFQTCRSHDDFCLRQLKVRRGQERTFQLTESASTIMSCPHALQAITCIQEDHGYGKYHGLEDSDDHPLFL